MLYLNIDKIIRPETINMIIMIIKPRLIISILSLMVQINITARQFTTQEIDEIWKQQHIFDICKNAQTNDEPCTIIKQIFKNDSEWHKISYFKKIWNFNKRPMPVDLTCAVLMAQAKNISIRMGWTQEQLQKEIEILFHFYENVINDKPQFKTHITFK